MSNFVAMEQLPPGAVLREDGTAVFPGTKRPDGTMRKDKPIRKLGDGRWYVPQEEAAKFQTKGAQLRDSAPQCPGLPPGAGGGGGGGAEEQPGPNAAKNAKKAEAKRKKKEEERLAAEAAAAAETERVAAEAASAEAKRLAVEADPAGAAAKTVKQLKKKLKQVVELQAKVDAAVASGGAAFELNDEQAAKLSKRDELEQALQEAEGALAALSVG